LELPTGAQPFDGVVVQADIEPCRQPVGATNGVDRIREAAADVGNVKRVKLAGFHYASGKDDAECD
jgi:hypothetical protein